MKKTVKGPFEIKSIPLPGDEASQAIGMMRMKFEKQFTGDLEANAVVSMMGMMNKDIGSGGYVALEKVTGTLQGRKGSFCLQHSSQMERGKSSQSILVVPDSGTEELTGLSGEMVIDIVEGQHFYTLSFKL